jgi:TonB family protein
MNGWLVRSAMAAVRLWTRVYTSGLPPAAADARRAEVESDLWESAHDSDPHIRSHFCLQIAARMLIGIPDDLGWRLEQEEAMTASFRQKVGLAACAVGIIGLLVVVWIAQPPVVPPLPGAPVVSARTHHPPPPPPPPPPPAAPGNTRAEAQRFVFAETSYTAHGTATTPQRVRDIPPVYPPVAMYAGVQGVVMVEATIDERGRVEKARVVQSAHWVLEQSAIDAVRQWEFTPTVSDGTRVPIVITARVNFSIPR